MMSVAIDCLLSFVSRSRIKSTKVCITKSSTVTNVIEQALILFDMEVWLVF